MKQKNYFSKIVFILFGLLIGLFILEIILRNYSLNQVAGMIRQLRGERLTDCQVSDINLNHKLLPNCKGVLKTVDFSHDIETNSLGLREKEIAPKKDGIYRILIVGDSFAEGWGVSIENRFSEIAQKLLEGKNIEIINAGVRSYSPVLELTYLKNEGLKLQPDEVIMFYDASDLHDDTYYGGWELHDKLKRELGFSNNKYAEVWPVPYKNILNNSKLFFTLNSLIGSRVLDNKRQITSLNLGTDISLFGYGQDWLDYKKAFNLNIANINLTKDYLYSKNIKFKLAVVPRGIYVGEKEWEKGRSLLKLEKSKSYDPIMFDVLNPDIDLLSPLKLAEKSNEGKLFYSTDGHWTSIAHEIVGRVVSDFIVKSRE